ncbi:MAG: hypothetical protein K2V71_03950 [Methylotenera sp.]|nr:hypothetical protein [Methylotenera sp.]OQW70609.1 MAG: hypothetical protein BVN34_01090 [Proteobacteria bacterium ST_bin12]
MCALIDIVSSADFWKIVLPALAAVIAWLSNERSKLIWEQYKRKEENYKELLRCLKGFYVGTQDKELKGQFIHQVNLLWLYAPDDVIETTYQFLEKVKTGANSADNAKELACGALVEAIRKDLLKRRIVNKTTLNASDFRNFTST